MEEQREQKRKKERKWRAADHIYDSRQLVDSLCASLLSFSLPTEKETQCPQDVARDKPFTTFWTLFSHSHCRSFLFVFNLMLNWTTHLEVRTWTCAR